MFYFTCNHGLKVQSPTIELPFVFVYVSCPDPYPWGAIRGGMTPPKYIWYVVSGKTEIRLHTGTFSKVIVYAMSLLDFLWTNKILIIERYTLYHGVLQEDRGRPTQKFNWVNHNIFKRELTSRWNSTFICPTVTLACPHAHNHRLTRKPSWRKGCARQQCVYTAILDFWNFKVAPLVRPSPKTPP